MRTNHKKRAIVAAGLLGISLVLSSCGSGNDDGPGSSGSDSKTIKVGVISSLTGAAAVYGEPMANGVRVMVDDYNKTSPIKIKLTVKDDKSDPTTGAQAATDLVNNEGVSAIIGPVISPIALAVAPIAANAKVPLLTVTSSAAITDKSKDFAPWVFVTSGTDNVVVPGVLDRAVKNGAKRVAIFYEETSSGTAAHALLLKRAKETNVDIVADPAVATTATDFSAQSAKIAAAKPDAVITQITTLSTGVGAVKALQQAGVTAPLYGSTGMANASFVKQAGSAAEGMRLVAFALDSAPTARVRKLTELLKAAGKTPAGGFSDVVMAAAVDCIQQAAQRAKDLTGTGLRDALADGTPIQTFYPKPLVYTADNRDGVGGDALVQTLVKNGTIVEET